MKDDHGLNISAATLIKWRDDEFPDRYERARENLAVKLGDEAEELAHEYAQIERQVVAKLRDNLDVIDARDLPGTLRNLATARGISTTNANVLRGRPTAITETRDASDVMRAIATRLGVHQPVVDASAVEVPQELPETTEAPNP